jgi:hypothetical protein
MELAALTLWVDDSALAAFLELAGADLRSICRVQAFSVGISQSEDGVVVLEQAGLRAVLDPQPMETA